MKRTMYEAARHTPKRQAVGSNPAKCAICSVENPMKSGLFGAFSFPSRGRRRRGFLIAFPGMRAG